MIEKNKHSSFYEICCDKCSYSDSQEELMSLRDFFELMRDQGWRTYKENGEFLHSCPNCVEEWRQQQRRNDEGY